ncbi:MAG: peptidase M14 [Armatimonadetes bacterium]|nr:peptidase M14 [Armatimonadota bacterium]
MLTGFLPMIAAAHASDAVRVDADFPGGNIIVGGFEGDEILVHQDLRDTEGDWFYWYFRVRGGAGRTLTVRFTQSNVIGVRGPAVSTDGARKWEWLGAEAVEGPAFRYELAPACEEVRFCFAMPYLEANLREFLSRHAGNANLQVGTLCTTAKGREVERLRVGCLEAPKHRVLVTARHHCCEMLASYALEGLIDAVLADEWLRGNVEFLAIPFVDKDGVEDGDQGKNRRPRDHNRDYEEESLYPSVRAVRQLVPEWSEGKLRIALDLHCPHIRGPHNEVIYLVGSPLEGIWAEASRFAELLETTRTGPLPYRAKDNLPFGQGWNTDANLGAGKSFCRWASELPGIDFATTIEIPYANAGGVAVTAESARAFGRDLAAAIEAYVREEG